MVVRLRKIGFLLAAMVCLMSSLLPVTLERASKERFQTALSLYAKKQNKAQLKRRIGYGLIAAGVAGFVGWGIISLVKSRQTNTATNDGFTSTDKKEKSDSSKKKSKKKDDSFWPEFGRALKKIAIYSLAGGMITAFHDMLIDAYHATKNFLTGSASISDLSPFSKRLEVELDRLCGSMHELQKNLDNPTLVAFHKKEVVSSFNILVTGLEKFSAVLYWHMKNGYPENEPVNIDHQFLFCNEVANCLETDLNRTVLSISPQTVDVVAQLVTAVLFLAKDHASLVKKG